MRKDFDGSFYTDDFDQEMLDFIKSNYSIDKRLPFDNTSGNYVRYDVVSNNFVVWRAMSRGYLTKQQFKEKIGMVDKNTFTKDDLEVGKHVVECRGGERFVVLDKGILLSLNGVNWGRLSHFTMELTHKCDHLDIVKVYLVEEKNIYICKDLPLVWQRTEKSEAQLKMEECQKQIKLLQEQMDKLQEEL